MLRRSTYVAAAIALTLRVAVAAASNDPCAVSWTDAAGDATYGLVYPVPLNDPDLDVTNVTFRATRTTVTVTVKVAALSAAGPTYGTGHGVGLYLTKYGKTLSFAARSDATYGDRTYASGDTEARRTPVRLVVDAAHGTYVLTVSRADIARLAGTRSTAGDLTGVGVFTLRNDHVGGTSESLPGFGSPSVGTSADDAHVAPSGARLSLDSCDARRR